MHSVICNIINKIAFDPFNICISYKFKNIFQHKQDFCDENNTDVEKHIIQCLSPRLDDLIERIMQEYRSNNHHIKNMFATRICNIIMDMYLTYIERNNFNHKIAYIVNKISKNPETIFCSHKFINKFYHREFVFVDLGAGDDFYYDDLTNLDRTIIKALLPIIRTIIKKVRPIFIRENHNRFIYKADIRDKISDRFFNIAKDLYLSYK